MNMPAISTVGGHVLENRSLAVQRYDRYAGDITLSV